MRQIPVVLVLAILLLLVQPWTTLADGDGVLQGQVVNGTAGGGSTEGLPVVLRVFQGASEQPSLSVTTDADGRFRLEGLETGSDWTYLLRVTYQEVIYSPGLVSFEAGQSEMVLDISVYEATTDDSQIRVGRAHLFVTASDETLSVSELYVFQNAGDRTYVGQESVQGRRWTAKFMLPAESRDLTPDDGSLGGRFLPIDGGFVDTEPQWPGSTSVLFSYVLECPRGRCDLSRVVMHAISDLNVLVADTGAAVESKTLAFDGKREAQGQSYLNYVGRDLTRGGALDLALLLPGATPAGAVSAQGGVQALPWIILGSIVAVIPLIYPFWRRRIEAAARGER